jgi:hypothetical protein
MYRQALVCALRYLDCYAGHYEQHVLAILPPSPLPRGHDGTAIGGSTPIVSFSHRFHLSSFKFRTFASMGNDRRKPASKGKAKQKVRFTDKPEAGKRKSSPAASSGAGPGPSRKKQRTADTQGASASAGTSTEAGSSSSSAAGAAPGSAEGAKAAGAAAAADEEDAAADKETPTKKRVRNPWGILPKEVKKEAKPTQVCTPFFYNNGPNSVIAESISAPYQGDGRRAFSTRCSTLRR